MNFFLAANYNPDEDEYLTKHSKGFNELHFDTHDRPICDQPGRPEKIIRWAKRQSFCIQTISNEILPLSQTNSSRIHEDDYRQIQTNVPFLAPEILAVFANSQIFHDNQPTKSLAIVHKSPTIHDDLKKHGIHSIESDSSEKKLLKRLEGNSFDWKFLVFAYIKSKKKNKNKKSMCKNQKLCMRGEYKRKNIWMYLFSVV